jgi:hypothetical protein
MRETAPVLRLNPAQAAQLIGYCTAYRSALWQSAMPTPERNQMIRRLQAFQGRLEKAQEQAQTVIALLVTMEEKGTLKHLLSGLIHLHGNTPPSDQRNQALGEVTECLLAIQRMLSQVQPFSVQDTGATS